MKISEVATQSGVNIQTVRLYERIGLLKEPRRTRAGYRDYTRSAVEAIRFIKSAQELGFTLREIKQLLELRDPTRASTARAGEMARSKIREIDEKIARLGEMRNSLVHRLENCRCRGRAEACLLLGAKTESEAL
jgi:DNA-binding transcriptional MerR regulator